MNPDEPTNPKPPEIHKPVLPQPAIPVQPPPLEPPVPENADIRTLIEALLRRPHALAQHLANPKNGATPKFALISLISLLLFGIVLGCFAKHEQLWAAPLKIAAGLLISGAICFPSLYIFATLAGSRIQAQQLAACLTGALALAGLLLLGFSPAIWIFAESTNSFGFMGALGIGAWIIAVFFAFKFLKQVIFSNGGTQRAPLTIWCAVFLLVTLQMTTSLRPILGRSPTVLTQEKKFFLEHWSEYFAENLPTTVTFTEE
ncbi:hypothetical protein JIN85_09845 [Luteolibacter pohnpeiensis]|uniref:Yip1 domain-containing protein n=1 Tax=Luteolibacter pohnpeiensis TaxID=454153 RepID=A0A934S7H9_9BACT|nr:hypothetical protein [Luteolibacter pohnpeiensis]MBK1882720.1 hypothetical protein [Luteolibacter pohnpeiensis]